LKSTTVYVDVVEEAINFIGNAKSRGDIVNLSNRTFSSPDSLSEEKKTTFFCNCFKEVF